MMDRQAGGTLLPGTAVILDPSFQLLGDLTIDLSMVTRRQLRMNGVQFSAPIDGTMCILLRCYADNAGTVEYRGFLVRAHFRDECSI
jgi:hypothetical protein